MRSKFSIIQKKEGQGELNGGLAYWFGTRQRHEKEEEHWSIRRAEEVKFCFLFCRGYNSW